MELKKLNNGIGVSAQICVDELALVKELGYTLIVCHRPDGEDADQVNFEEIEQAAKKLDLPAIYQPVLSGKINDADVATFKNILLEAKGPVFAYCRTGTRCTTLWSLAKAGELPLSEILATAKNAGYDMSGVASRIVNGGSTQEQ
jgi:sulfide:quinone oxidoreductase